MEEPHVQPLKGTGGGGIIPTKLCHFWFYTFFIKPSDAYRTRGRVLTSSLANKEMFFVLLLQEELFE